MDGIYIYIYSYARIFSNSFGFVYCSSKDEKTTLAKDDPRYDTQAGGEFLTSKPRFKKDSVPKTGVTRPGRTTKKQLSSTVTAAYSLDEDHSSLHKGSTQML
jgi:hypothetical protein